MDKRKETIKDVSIGNITLDQQPCICIFIFIPVNFNSLYSSYSDFDLKLRHYTIVQSAN